MQRKKQILKKSNQRQKLAHSKWKRAESFIPPAFFKQAIWPHLLHLQMRECFGPENVKVYPAEATANCTRTQCERDLSNILSNRQQRVSHGRGQQERNGWKWSCRVQLLPAGHRVQTMGETSGMMFMMDLALKTTIKYTEVHAFIHLWGLHILEGDTFKCSDCSPHGNGIMGHFFFAKWNS